MNNRRREKVAGKWPRHARFCTSDTPARKGYAIPRFPMSSNTSPESYPQPSFLRRHGCLTFLAVVVLLLVAGVLFARYMIFSTPLPYRIVAALIEKANPNVHISGLTGDIQKGLNVGSITWGQMPGSPSEIRDLRIRYNGYGEAGKTHRIVLNEVAVSRAHIDLADLPTTNSTTTTTTTTSGGTATTTTVEGGATSTTTVSSSSSSGTSTTMTSRTRAGSAGPTLPAGVESFEIERVSIEDVLITNRNSPFRLSIPKIAWTGFKVTPTSFEPGLLTVESDRLTLRTEAGRKVSLEDTDVTFQKLLKGVAQPALHPAIKQPIAFAADLTFLPQGDVRPFHILLDDGRLEISGTADGAGSVRARQVDLASYIDPKKVFGDQAADLPSEVVVSAVATAGFADGSGSMKIAGGSFRLGVAKFQIQPLEFTKADQNAAVLKAVLKTDAGEIVWELPLANFGDDYRPRLTSPGMPPEEAVSRVFTGRSYQQLSPEERKAVDERVEVYIPGMGR